MRKTKPASAPLIVSIACFTYLISVLQRSSIGVSALEASARFEVSTAALSLLGVAQFAVYAAMQVPAGLMLDRFGSRSMLVFGSLVAGLGQLVVGLAPIFSTAVLGRLFVGFGDAFIFISLTRLVSAWYSGRRASIVQQRVANIGQLGQVLSAIPFHFALEKIGWSGAFAASSSFSFGVVGLLLAFLPSSPMVQEVKGRADSRLNIVKNLKDPGVRTAFWLHFSLQASGSSFALFWGYPYLVEGLAMTPGDAVTILSSLIFIGFAVGPIISSYGSRDLVSRRRATLFIGLAICSAWVVLILQPTTPPTWLVLCCVVIICSGGPASMMAFDYSRELVPSSRMGTANGMINMGGFVAALSLIFIVGSLLEVSAPDQNQLASFTLGGFNLAFICEPLMVLFGLFFFWLESRKLIGPTALQSKI